MRRFEQSKGMPSGSGGSDPGAIKAPSDLMFAQVMSQTRMAITLADPHKPDHPLVFANKAFCNLTGYAAEEVIGRNCRFLQGEGTSETRKSAIRSALERNEVIVTELRNYRKDGTPFWNALHIGPVFDNDGELLYYYGSQWDVTNVHAARADEEIARMLSRELSHRMKNMFSVMNAIVAMTGRGETDALAATEKISGRIMALGRAHEATLVSASGTEPVDLAPMLSTVLDPYDRGDRIALSGSPVRLDSNTVSMLGLALHELAINAIKYGALSDPDGHVSLSWTCEPESEEDLLTLTWRERGGPAVHAPEELGLGSGIIASLLASADGAINYDWAPDGVVAVISLPLPRR